MIPSTEEKYAMFAPDVHEEFLDRLRAKWSEIITEPIPGLENVPSDEAEILELHRRLMIPSTPQSIINDMSDLVLTAPGDRVTILVDLFDSIERGLIVEGKTERDRLEFWHEVIVMLRAFMVSGGKTK
jgi:hypothetical protein